LRVVGIVAKKFLATEHVEYERFLFGTDGGSTEAGDGTGTE
jgi:hypothetical protein